MISMLNGYRRKGAERNRSVAEVSEIAKRVYFAGHAWGVISRAEAAA